MIKTWRLLRAFRRVVQRETCLNAMSQGVCPCIEAAAASVCAVCCSLFEVGCRREKVTDSNVCLPWCLKMLNTLRPRQKTRTGSDGEWKVRKGFSRAGTTQGKKQSVHYYQYLHALPYLIDSLLQMSCPPDVTLEVDNI